MTTNHIECLDPALIRPGRIDVIQKLDVCTRDQMVRFFLRFFEDAAPEDAHRFANVLYTHTESKGGCSPAFIQNLLLRYRDKGPTGLLAELPIILQE